MPTAAEFRHAASILRGDQEILIGIESRIRHFATGVTDGPYKDIAARGIAAGTFNALNTRNACESVAQEFDRRAFICDEYSSAMSNWRYRHYKWQTDPSSGPNGYHPTPAPSQPARPALWAEES